MLILSMTELDVQIQAALESLRHDRGKREFDALQYIAAFQQSAYDKAQSVLDLLATQRTFSSLNPVFLSVGGGDGAELEHLLRNSRAVAGVLLEGARPLADAARKRASQLPSGKEITIFEGDAKETIREGVTRANSLVAAGRGDYVCVTCHAVLHELFDRGSADFDPVGFFATIFEDYTTSTWFTYREPGVPDKWPNVVMVEAACEPHSLLPLAQAISDRHRAIRELRPEPQVVGDHVRMHRILAMELLAKLFYLPDLAHEIEERSTAVDHGQLTNMLWSAIGDRAREASRANIYTASQPTQSFRDLWQKLGISVQGIDDRGISFRLAIAESQSRIIAWRLADSVPVDGAAPRADLKVEDPVMAELLVARHCLNTREHDLLCAVLESKARAWIESARAAEALELLREIRERFPPDDACHLWSHYGICLGRLFAGGPVQVADFDPAIIESAEGIGIGLLFKAERMEFHRKTGELEAALELGNELIGTFVGDDPSYSSDTAHYVNGTAAFLIGNLLRHGGLYQRAWEAIDRAQSIFRSGPASQATELAHCYYAKAVCVAMTGMSQFDAPFDEGQPGGPRFANALITLSYSHASWFVRNELRARQFALHAARQFADLGFEKYAARARDLAALLGWWQSLDTGQKLDFDMENEDLARIVRILIGSEPPGNWLLTHFSQLRPSVAIGVLQFWQRYGHASEGCEVTLPPVLEMTASGGLRWRPGEGPVSVRRADEILRAACSIPSDLRVPLIAD
jgi:hypothetical protein